MICPRWTSLLCLVLVIGFSSGLGESGGLQEDIDQNVVLPRILRSCAEYCDRLASVLLDFVCTETVREDIIGPNRTKIIRHIRRSSKLWISYLFNDKIDLRSDMVYDYQLLRKKDKLEENRILIEENGKKRNRKNARLRTRFAHKNIIFGPIGLLSWGAQSLHRYRILGQETLAGENAVIIEAVPIVKSDKKYLYGRIWVRERDSAILKIQWFEESVEGYGSLLTLAKATKTNLEILLTTEYAFEKNGIRFPSSHRLLESYRPLYATKRSDSEKKQVERYVKSTKEVEYKDYKFFEVSTEVSVLKKKKP